MDALENVQRLDAAFFSGLVVRTQVGPRPARRVRAAGDRRLRRRRASGRCSISPARPTGSRCSTCRAPTRPRSMRSKPPRRSSWSSTRNSPRCATPAGWRRRCGSATARPPAAGAHAAPIARAEIGHDDVERTVGHRDRAHVPERLPPGAPGDEQGTADGARRAATSCRRRSRRSRASWPASPADRRQKQGTAPASLFGRLRPAQGVTRRSRKANRNMIAMAVNGTYGRRRRVDMRSAHYQELKSRIHQELLNRLNLERLTRMRREDAEPEIRSLIVGMLERESRRTPLSLFEREALITDVLNELFGLGPLEALLRDPAISDILVNRFDQVYIERERQARSRPTSSSRTTATCCRSSSGSSARSAGASTSRARWSTPASPTARASTRSSRRSRSTGRRCRFAGSGPTGSARTIWSTRES